jgi:uncharacterized protein YecE (DUF72 family)
VKTGRTHSPSPSSEATANPVSKYGAQLRIGISGWTYKPWRGTFYPPKWGLKKELAYASREVNSVEINGSFYSLQRPSSYQQWYRETPDDFLFSVKGGRFITHMKRLQNVETPLANFFASGLLCLREKLGPILWQLPPHFLYNEEKLARFFDLLPRTTTEAAALAKKHDDRLKGRAWTESDAERPLRYALEIRHESFRTPAFVELLRRHQIGLVIADTAGKWPFFEDTTADLVYIRLHGDEELYVSGYTDESLEKWRGKIDAWSRGKDPKNAVRIAPVEKTPPAKRDVFVYFDNDVKVRAPFDAMLLAYKLGVGKKPLAGPDPATIDEVARTVWPALTRASADRRWAFGRSEGSQTAKKAKNIKRPRAASKARSTRKRRGIPA